MIDANHKGINTNLSIDNLSSLEAMLTIADLVTMVRNLIVKVEPNNKNRIELVKIREIAQVILNFSPSTQVPKGKRFNTMNILETHPSNIVYGVRDFSRAEEIHLAFSLVGGDKTVSIWNHGRGALPEDKE